MTTHNINPDALAAIALASSTEQTRYYLFGVLVETYKDGSYGLIATDGHRLHAIYTQPEPVASYILSNDDIKKALAMYKLEAKSLPKGLRGNLNLLLSHEDGIVKINLGLMDGETSIGKGGFDTKPIDGTFPDWRRVIPASTSEGSPVMAFNADYMADFGEANKLLGGLKVQHIQVTSTGIQNPMLIKLAANDAFIGVLMPVRF